MDTLVTATCKICRHGFLVRVVGSRVHYWHSDAAIRAQVCKCGAPLPVIPLSLMKGGETDECNKRMPTSTNASDKGRTEI